MGLAAKILGIKSVSASVDDLYVVPANKSAIVKTISFVNTDSSVVTVILYIAAGGQQRRISEVIRIPAKGQFLFQQTLTLGATEAVRAEALINSALDAVVCGLERDND